MNKHIITGITLCLLLTNGYTQECDFRNLVFEGAGVRGIAYAGAIDELERRELLDNIEKVGGTSAGAIIALMVSLGYSSKEIAEIISSTKFRKFNDGRFMFIGGLIRMKRLFGWYRGDRFAKWISKIIENKTGNSEITFEELSLAGAKNLYITGTCLNKQRLIIFSRENYPQMKVKQAIRISMSIPLYFKAVFIDSIGATLKKPDKTQNADIVVDGGIIGNFPIFMFDDIEMDSTHKEHRVPNYQTLGMRIDSDEQIQKDAGSRKLAPMEIKNFNGYISALYTLVIESLNRNELTSDDWSRTISISSAGVGPRIKKLSNKQKERLINSGRSFTSKHMDNYCMPEIFK